METALRVHAPGMLTGGSTREINAEDTSLKKARTPLPCVGLNGMTETLTGYTRLVDALIHQIN